MHIQPLVHPPLNSRDDNLVWQIGSNKHYPRIWRGAGWIFQETLFRKLHFQSNKYYCHSKYLCGTLIPFCTLHIHDLVIPLPRKFLFFHNMSLNLLVIMVVMMNLLRSFWYGWSQLHSESREAKLLAMTVVLFWSSPIITYSFVYICLHVFGSYLSFDIFKEQFYRIMQLLLFSSFIVVSKLCVLFSHNFVLGCALKSHDMQFLFDTYTKVIHLWLERVPAISVFQLWSTYTTWPCLKFPKYCGFHQVQL